METKQVNEIEKTIKVFNKYVNKFDKFNNLLDDIERNNNIINNYCCYVKNAIFDDETQEFKGAYIEFGWLLFAVHRDKEGKIILCDNATYYEHNSKGETLETLKLKLKEA